ncbi:hypothetical protein UFOVP633_5 [uncultured Caudovirales phage]|jgi:uncharacterized protein (DUF736 family)|uniref:DUF736 domain-containing protein n=1 Tax=uncultured Caudovirales phage TaxID=2100421 RepID=A0A6J5N5R7_9CAUD|nr:hypothetical protein UFOVP633_5 [uncultured Caudovirales phage]
MSEQSYDNTNRGAIFKNDNKTSDNHPDYKGTINVDGVDKQIALWLKTSKDGSKKFFSAAISNPYVKDEQISTVKPIADVIDTEGDDLPF